MNSPETGTRREAEEWRGVAREGRNLAKARTKERRIAAQYRSTLGIVVKEAFLARKAELNDEGAASRYDCAFFRNKAVCRSKK